MDGGQGRRLAELAFPGFVVGLLGGLVAGGLTVIVGQPVDVIVIVALALGVPLGLLGGGYSLLVAKGVAKPGTFAPAALYWLIGFPLARLVHEVCTQLAVTGRPGVPANLFGFLAYQAIVSAGFAIGFVWLHERIAPQWLYRVADRNPDAARVFEHYAAHAQALWETKQARRRRREARKGRVGGRG